MIKSWRSSLFEESLAHSLVYDDKSYLWKFIPLASWVILVSHNFLELIKLKLDDLLAHRITNTIAIDENVIWETAVIVVTICFKCTTKVILQYAGGDDLLALLLLRVSLSVVLA